MSDANEAWGEIRSAVHGGEWIDAWEMAGDLPGEEGQIAKAYVYQQAPPEVQTSLMVDAAIELIATKTRNLDVESMAQAMRNVRAALSGVTAAFAATARAMRDVYIDTRRISRATQSMRALERGGDE